MKTQRSKKIKNFHTNEAGFIFADFIFSMVLVISSCSVVFVLCFALATVEISQYITWSVARAYSAGNISADKSQFAGKQKFFYLAAEFPLLTGVRADKPWFELRLQDVGNNNALIANLDQINVNNSLASGENRQPWTGAAAELDISLLRRMQLPFIGKLSTDDSVFTYNLKAFILRNPSQEECLGFYTQKYEEGIRKLENSWNGQSFLTNKAADFVAMEDNGC